MEAGRPLAQAPRVLPLISLNTFTFGGIVNFMLVIYDDSSGSVLARQPFSAPKNYVGQDPESFVPVASIFSELPASVRAIRVEVKFTGTDR